MNVREVWGTERERESKHTVEAHPFLLDQEATSKNANLGMSFSLYNHSFSPVKQGN